MCDAAEIGSRGIRGGLIFLSDCDAVESDSRDGRASLVCRFGSLMGGLWWTKRGWLVATGEGTSLQNERRDARGSGGGKSSGGCWSRKRGGSMGLLDEFFSTT